MNQSSDIRIDVAGVLRQRLPRHYRYIPRFLVRWLERTICQDRMNDLLEKNSGKTDADFCRGVIDYLNVKYTVTGQERLPDNRRVVFVSNHPLGGLDGMILIDYITALCGGRVRFVVNDLLMAIKPLAGVFLPINKHGKQSRGSSETLDAAFSGDDPIIIFPAGLVSRRQPDGHIEDLTWRKMFVNKCAEYRRDIIPLYFDGENSSFFYKFAKLRTRIGLKFNIEMIYLPREVFLSEGKSYSIKIGNPIGWESLDTGRNAAAQAEKIKRVVYNLKGG